MRVSYIQWLAEEARCIYGEVIPSPWMHSNIQVTRELVGVVGANRHWNFPISMRAHNIGLALTAGCTKMAKPTLQTPYSGLTWGVSAEQVGITRVVGNLLAGSIAVGKVVIPHCPDSVKSVYMETVGNAPFIAFNEAIRSRAVEGAVAAKFRNAGKTCMCTNRLSVRSSFFDEFVAAFAAASSPLQVGSGFALSVTQGPLNDAAAVAKVADFEADAKAEGGQSHALCGLNFMPIVIAHANPSSKFVREEIFGPVAPVFRFDTKDEAVQAVNAADYGVVGHLRQPEQQVHMHRRTGIVIGGLAREWQAWH